MRAFLIGLAALGLWSVPVSGATPVDVKPGKTWKHKATGTAFPATLAGLQRTSVVYFTAPEVDVAANYQGTEGGDQVTIYLYRNVAANVPVWFDRSRYFIMNLPEKYGASVATGTRAFVPRGQTASTGLMETFKVDKGGTSTGLMVLPLNGFYAKLRATSATRDTASLERLMLDSANAFEWRPGSEALPAIPVADCSKPFGHREAAKKLAGDDAQTLLAGLLGGATAQLASKPAKKAVVAAPPGTFCREPNEANLGFGMYRLKEDTNRYVLAVHDGGRAIFAGRNELSELVLNERAESEGKPAGPSRYNVTFVQLEKTETYADFDSLPLPSQAVDEVEKGQPVSTASTWGKNRDVSLYYDPK